MPFKSTSLIRSILPIYHRAELGNLVKLKSYFSLHSNSLTSTVPSYLGNLARLSAYFQLYSNMGLCDALPAQVQALSDTITTGWEVTAGNSLGTICGWQEYMADSRFPTMDGLVSTTSLAYGSQGLTGTVRVGASMEASCAQKGDYFIHVALSLSNLFYRRRAQVPTEFGIMTEVTQLYLQSNDLSGVFPTGDRARGCCPRHPPPPRPPPQPLHCRTATRNN